MTGTLPVAGPTVPVLPGASGAWREGDPVGDRLFVALDAPLPLESGASLDGVQLAYETWGRFDGTNAVLVLHALTGDSHVVGERGPDQPTPGWWPGLVGPGAPLDTDEWFVVAPDVLGGCRGTTGPSSPAPDGRPYGSTFPRVTVRDQVRAEALLADTLGIRSFALVVGGSVGGMRSLEWAVSYPGRVRRCVVLAAGASGRGTGSSHGERGEESASFPVGAGLPVLHAMIRAAQRCIPVGCRGGGCGGSVTTAHRGRG